MNHVTAGLGRAFAAKGTLVCLGNVSVFKVSPNAILLWLFCLDGNEITAVSASRVLLPVEGHQFASLAAQPGQPGLFLQQHRVGLKACCVGQPPALRGAG